MLTLYKLLIKPPFTDMAILGCWKAMVLFIMTLTLWLPVPLLQFYFTKCCSFFFFEKILFGNYHSYDVGNYKVWVLLMILHTLVLISNKFWTRIFLFLSIFLGNKITGRFLVFRPVYPANKKHLFFVLPKILRCFFHANIRSLRNWFRKYIQVVLCPVWL